MFGCPHPFGTFGEVSGGAYCELVGRARRGRILGTHSEPGTYAAARRTGRHFGGYIIAGEAFPRCARDFVSLSPRAHFLLSRGQEVRGRDREAHLAKTENTTKFSIVTADRSDTYLMASAVPVAPLCPVV